MKEMIFTKTFPPRVYATSIVKFFLSILFSFNL